MQFVGSPTIFQFDRIHNNIGAVMPGTVVNYQNLVFFLSDEGFYSFDGTTLDPIGRGKVDEYFKETNAPYVANNNLCATVDPTRKIVIWGYAGGTGSFSRLLCFHWPTRRWTELFDTDKFYSFIAMCRPATQGDPAILGAFTNTGGFGRFAASAMPATVQTGEFQLIPEQRAMITEIRPDVIGLSAGMALTVMNRNNLTESLSTGAASVSVNATGFCQFRLSSRYFQVKLTTAPGVDFDHLMGVEVDGVSAGRR
jgi:hypothetical protein